MKNAYGNQKKTYRKQSLFLPCEFQEADSGCQAGRQTLLSALLPFPAYSVLFIQVMILTSG